MHLNREGEQRKSVVCEGLLVLNNFSDLRSTNRYPYLKIFFWLKVNYFLITNFLSYLF